MEICFFDFSENLFEIHLPFTHTQIAIHANVGTRQGHHQAAHKDSAYRSAYNDWRNQTTNVEILHPQQIDAHADKPTGNKGSNQTYCKGFPHKGAADETRASSHKLHRVNGEAASIDAHAYRVVDKREGNKC